MSFPAGRLGCRGRRSRGSRPIGLQTIQSAGVNSNVRIVPPAFLVSPAASFMTGQVVRVNGGAVSDLSEAVATLIDPFSQCS